MKILANTLATHTAYAPLYYFFCIPQGNELCSGCFIFSRGVIHLGNLLSHAPLKQIRP